MSIRDIAAPPRAGFFIAAGNASSSCPAPMTLETQMTLALLQELLMALRANDADGYKGWALKSSIWGVFPSEIRD